MRRPQYRHSNSMLSLVDRTIVMENLSRSERCQRSFLNLDMYRREFSLLLPDRQQHYRTFLGSLLTILTISIILPYVVWKVTIMVSMTDYKLQIQDFENYYSLDRTFGMEQNFMIAGAITTADTSNEIETDPSIGELKFYIKSWGNADDEG